jgi:hypothetical protein
LRPWVTKAKLTQGEGLCYLDAGWSACGRGQHVNADGAGTGAQAIGGKTRGCLTDRCSQQVKKLHQRQQPILHCRNNTHVNFSQISHPGDFDEFKVRVDAGQRNVAHAPFTNANSLSNRQRHDASVLADPLHRSYWTTSPIRRCSSGSAPWSKRALKLGFMRCNVSCGLSCLGYTCGRYWNHSGMWTTETTHLTGAYDQSDYGASLMAPWACAAAAYLKQN